MERSMQKTLGITAIAAMSLTLPQVGVAQTSSQTQNLPRGQSSQNIKGEKIPGRPNGMESELKQDESQRHQPSSANK